ncbi:MAG: hypothetical protein J0I12_12915 [Candidatus Eremiobacteraeota bacterium]|nr:hypothetical protein [Candidatus Eremiobacteraeota bacterium]
MTETTVNTSRKVPLGPGTLLAFRDGSPAPARTIGLQARIRLSGPLAAVELRHSFTNPYPHALEFCYLFPWNEGASLSRFRAQIGTRTLETLPAASQELAENRRPTALAPYFAEESAPVFSVGLGLLEPGETVAIELFYAELSQDFHFPLAGCPQAQLQILLEAPTAYECNLPVRRQVLANGDVLLDPGPGPFSQDLVLSQHRQLVLRQSPHHFLLQTPDPNSTSRDLVLLIDGSENATPERFAAAQQLARQQLTQLDAHSQFALVSFHHQIEGFELGAFQPQSKAEAALQWLARQRPAGRADMAVLLERVLSLPRRGPLEVLLIACGPVGNEPELYAQVCAAPQPPVFRTVALGPANHAFLRRLEAVTRPNPWVDQGLQAQQASCTGIHTVLGRKSGTGGVSWQGQPAAPNPCANPALPMLWASHKVAEMLDELKLVHGPRASQLRQISQALCREYRLMTEISPMTVDGKQLAGLDPQSWTRSTPPPVLKPRIRPVLVSEPPPVRAGLVPPQGSTPSPTGLKAKISQSKKYDAKRKPSKPALKKTHPVAQAKRLLAIDREAWKSELRALYRDRQADQLAILLVRLRFLSDRSSVLAEVYRIGLACYQGLRAGHPKAGERAAQWVEKFASLFK